jgi:hypothetical protein
MTAPRVYPAKIAARERKLLGDALAMLHAHGAENDLTRAIAHRLACATRYDEMREKRLSAEEREAVASILRGVLSGLILAGAADMARVNARALVRLMR